jgi:hypothetical protein
MMPHIHGISSYMWLNMWYGQNMGCLTDYNGISGLYDCGHPSRQKKRLCRLKTISQGMSIQSNHV